MSDSDQDILIRILTAYEGGGIEAAKKAAADLAGSVEKNSAAGKELDAVTKLMNNNAGQAARIFSGLSGVMRGGFDSAQGLTTALRGVGAVLGATGPVALALAAAGAIVTGLLRWKQHNEDAAEAAKKAAEEQVKAAEDAKKSLEDLNKTKAEAVIAEVSAISDKLTQAAATAKELRDTLATMENAQLELEFAGIDKAVAEGSMSREEGDFTKARRKVEVEKIQVQRELDDAQKQLQVRQQQVEEAEKRAAAAKADADAKKKAAADAISSLNASEKELAGQRLALADAGVGAEYQQAYAGVAVASQVRNSRRKTATATGQASEAATSESDQAQSFLKTTVADATKEIQRLQSAIAVAATKIETKNTVLQTTAIEGRNSVAASMQARQDKEFADAEKESQRQADAAADAEANMPPEERLNRAVKRGVAPGQRIAGQMYTGEAAGDTRQKAQAAIEEAGQKIMDGADDAKIVGDLLATLQKLGAIIPNWGRLKAELDKLDGKIDLVASQTKNNRG